MQKVFEDLIHLARPEGVHKHWYADGASRFLENMKAEQNMENGGISYKTVK